MSFRRTVAAPFAGASDVADPKKHLSERARFLLYTLSFFLLVGAAAAEDSFLEDESISLFDRANRALVLENIDIAQKLYQKVLEDPTLSNYHDHALFLLARCYNLQNEWEQAEMTLRQLLVTYPQSELLDNAFFLMGEHFASETQEKDLTLALENYKIVVLRFPKGDKSDEAAYRLGELSIELGRWKEAERYFEALVVRELPEKMALDSRFALAETYRNSKNPNRDIRKALKIYQETADKFPGRDRMPKLYFGMGMCHRDLGEHSLAIRQFEQLIKEYPSSLFATVAQPMLAESYKRLQENLISKLLEQASEDPEKKSVEANPEVLNFIETLKSTVKNVTITADAELPNGKYRGNVQLTKADLKLVADEIVFDRKTYEVKAAGNVNLTRGDLILAKCGALRYDLREEIVDLQQIYTVVMNGEVVQDASKMPQARLSLETNRLVKAE